MYGVIYMYLSLSFIHTEKRCMLKVFQNLSGCACDQCGQMKGILLTSREGVILMKINDQVSLILSLIRSQELYIRIAINE